jgi:ribosomal protein S18 acetylase RimI-like enzyme
MATIVPAPTPLLEALEANLHGHVAFVQRQLPSMLVDDREDLLLVDSRLRTDAFNKILRARLREKDADRRIAEAVSHFRTAGRPFAWWVGPCSRPLDLERRLERHGLRAAEFELGMAADCANLPTKMDLPAGLEIRCVRTPAELADFATVVAGDPPDREMANFFLSAEPLVLEENAPMQLFAGYLDGRAAASSELFLSDGIAGIYGVSTLPGFQRRGIGLAMTWAAADQGRRRRAATAALQASDAGRGVYARLGFSPCCQFVEYQ